MARADSKRVAAEHRKPREHVKPNVRHKLQESSQLDPLILPQSSSWHTILPQLPPAPALSAPSAAQINSLMEKGALLLDKDTKNFLSTSSSSNEATFFTKVVQSGTLSDRLSALTLLVQSSPVHNTKALETLKGMSGKGGGGRGESLKAVRCIVDWWVGGGAPNRKLKYLRDQPLLHPRVTDMYLLVWYFEDWLKKYFFSVLQTLETLSLDPLLYVRTQAISLIFNLLKDKPEQEQNLLRLLVNKLGDASKSVCSRASYHLLQLLQVHPSMKPVVVGEIISLVLKSSTPSIPLTSTTPTNRHTRFSSPEPSTKTKPLPKMLNKKTHNSHAQYYATITFNQIILTPSEVDHEVAVRLIDIYFELFKDVLGSDPAKAPSTQDMDEKILEKDGGVQKDNKGRVLVKSTKERGKKFEKSSGAAGFIEVEDSDSKLVSALLTGVNRALPFVKVETGYAKINAHLDTLFHITHKSTFNISIQALVLIQQITMILSKTSSTIAKPIIDRYFRTLYESLHDYRLGTSSKQAMYLNLLYKSIKTDPEFPPDRKKAMIKRFTQVLVSGGSGATEFVAGGLYLLGELFSTVPGLRSMIFDSENSKTENYDPRKRDPHFSHADHSPCWELVPLLSHYHPTISLLTRQLLAAQPLTTTADLTQNTLSHFLDRFVYKNPKKKASAVEGKGASAMQPAGSAIEGVKLRRGEFPGVQVNLPTFWKKKESQIPVDQLFFYNYFKRVDERDRRIRKKKEGGRERNKDGDENEDEDEDEDEDGDEDEETEKSEPKAFETNLERSANVGEDEDASDLEEAEIWKVMRATMPKEVDEGGPPTDSSIEEDEDDLSSDFSAAMVGDDDREDISEDDSLGSGQNEKENDTDDCSDSLLLGEDDDDLIPLDEIPTGLIAYDGSDNDDDEIGTEIGAEEEWRGISLDKSRKRKRGAAEERSSTKRKTFRSLPTFASYDDYAKMIEDGPEDDI